MTRKAIRCNRLVSCQIPDHDVLFMLSITPEAVKRRQRYVPSLFDILMSLR